MCLAVFAERFGRSVSTADVGELVAECVGDDVGVESLALAAASKRVSDLEGEFGVRAVALATLEGDGGCALAEVCGSTSGGTSSCVTSVAIAGVVVVALVGVSSVVVGIAGVSIVLVALVGISSILVALVRVASVLVALVGIASVSSIALVGIACVALVSITSIACVLAGITSGAIVLVGIASIAGVSSVALVGIALVCVTGVALVSIASVALVCVSSVSASCSTASCSTTSRSLGSNKITKASGLHEIKDTQAIGVERSALTLLAECRSFTVDIDIRVDERGNTTELRSGRERSITTDVLDVVVGEGVGVLLSSNKANGGSNSISAASKLSDDLVGTGELFCT